MPNPFYATDFNGYCVSENLGKVLASIGITSQTTRLEKNTLRFFSADLFVESFMTIGNERIVLPIEHFPLFINERGHSPAKEQGYRPLIEGKRAKKPVWFLGYDKNNNQLLCSVSSERERRTAAHAIIEYILAEGVRKLVKMKLDERKKELMEAVKGNPELEAKTKLMFSQAFKEIDAMKGAELEKVRVVLALKTAEISMEKTALEEKLKRIDLMPDLPPSAIAKGCVAFKDERGYTTIGKKINVMPKRARGGDLLSKNIDVPVEAIRGYVCAKMLGGRVSSVYMRHEDMSGWKDGLYHIGTDGHICLGNLTESKSIYAIKNTESVMALLDSVEKMFETINLTSLLSTGDFRGSHERDGDALHLALNYLRTATRLVLPENGNTKKECLESPYRVGAFYEQRGK